MTLIKRYAIEPKALQRWDDFRYVMEKLSFADGKVLVTMPRKWIRHFLDGLGDIGDIERQRFVTKLQRYKEDRMISSGTPYDTTLRWVDNALQEISQHRIEAILISEETSSSDVALRLPTPADIDEAFFSGSREIRCISSLEELLSPAKIFLASDTEAIFVDPYFRVTSHRCIAVIKEFATYACKIGCCNSFSIFTSQKFLPKGGEESLRSILTKQLGGSVGAGFRIAVHYVKTEASQHSFHARYLLTHRGGLRYDKGFEVGDPPELVDVSLLDKMLHSELLSHFSETCSELAIAETCKWRAE